MCVCCVCVCVCVCARAHVRVPARRDLRLRVLCGCVRVFWTERVKHARGTATGSKNGKGRRILDRLHRLSYDSEGLSTRETLAGKENPPHDTLTCWTVARPDVDINHHVAGKDMCVGYFFPGFLSTSGARRGQYPAPSSSHRTMSRTLVINYPRFACGHLPESDN
jgi:hypothetical protein